jgi:molybdenum cofactor biosynthesis protein B
MEREFVRVNVAVLSVSDAHNVSDETTGKLIVDRLTEAGHHIAGRENVKDSAQLIRAHFLRWIADPDVDVVLVTGGVEADSTGAALGPLITKRLDGFSDLFRLLSYEEIGTSAMLIDALAAQCGSTYVFVLPASIGAARTALDRILIPQLDHRTKPRNLVMRMPRVVVDPRHARPHPKISAEASAPSARQRPTPQPTSTKAPPWITPREATVRAPASPVVAPSPAAVPVPIPSAPTQPLPLPTVTPAIDAVRVPAPPIVGPTPSAVPVPIPSAPTQRLPLPTVAPAIKAPNLATPANEITAVGPPPPPVPRRTTNLPVTVPHELPSMVPAAAATPASATPAIPSIVPAAATPPSGTPAIPAIVPAAAVRAATPPRATPAVPSIVPAVRAATPASATPVPARPTPIAPRAEPKSVPVIAVPEPEPELEPDPEPVHVNGTHAPRAVATAVVPPSEPETTSNLGSIDLAGLSRVIDSSIANSTAGAVATTADLPTFRGDAFPEGRRRRTNTKKIALVLIACALVAVCVAGVVTFIRDRNREASASAGAHRDRAAARTMPPAPIPEPTPAPPEVSPPDLEPAPPEIVIDETPKPTPPAPTGNKPTPTAKTPATVAKVTKPPAPAKPPVSPTIAAIKAPAPTADGCDEVSCVLDRYKRPCCERYRPADPGPKVRNGLPDTLDRAMVTSGIGKMKPVVIGCGEKAGVKGTVKLAIEVAADGHVADINVASTPDDALGACVAAAIRKATFAKTQNGASFSYPFAF